MSPPEPLIVNPSASPSFPTSATPYAVLGVLDATLSSGNGSNGSGSVKILSGQVGALFEDNSFGVATCLLSLTANLVATLLIAFKAWYVTDCGFE